MNTLPKSLHTVTVLVNVARECMAHREYSDRPGDHDAVADALAILGYTGAPDAYGLADKARAVLSKECARSAAGERRAADIIMGRVQA